MQEVRECLDCRCHVLGCGENAEYCGACANERLSAVQQTLSAVEHEVAKVYCHITNGQISKCNTLASVVISVADDIAMRDTEAETKRALPPESSATQEREGQ